MKEKNKILLSILLGFVGFFLWNLYYDSYEKLYTVGEVIGKSSGLKSGTSVQFQFMHNGKRIEGSSWQGSYASKKGTRFIVEFGKEKVSVSSILLYYPIPNSLEIEIPISGWLEIPDEIKKQRLKRKEIFGLMEHFHKD
ncbi:hypothetical protein [Mongoliitalea daihaiensis]|uniref:hypothetical protein n=1 Tax=Mongoliitalea daihaiensis TaxID=2782006 RepID=UPI001F20B995|nr:hypothetical protein [Mongoliitalea daihaiensis]UJP66349.1 hypothetical protein IPZ59_07000 [Mongoliitalea daihaiensis]